MPGGKGDWLSDDEFELLKMALLTLLGAAALLNAGWAGLQLLLLAGQVMKLLLANFRETDARALAGLRRRMDTLTAAFRQCIKDLLKYEGVKIGLVTSAAVAVNKLDSLGRGSGITA